jgi:hypothetical protein
MEEESRGLPQTSSYNGSSLPAADPAEAVALEELGNGELTSLLQLLREANRIVLALKGLTSQEGRLDMCK